MYVSVIVYIYIYTALSNVKYKINVWEFKNFI